VSELRKITVICCAPDCSSVQTFACQTLRPFEDISHVNPLGLPEGFTVIAVVEGWPNLKVRDDARTAEWGVQ